MITYLDVSNRNPDEPEALFDLPAMPFDTFEIAPQFRYWCCGYYYILKHCAWQAGILRFDILFSLRYSHTTKTDSLLESAPMPSALDLCESLPIYLSGNQRPWQAYGSDTSISLSEAWRSKRPLILKREGLRLTWYVWGLRKRL